MAKEISRLLSQRAEDVVRHLLPNGKKVGNEWRVGSINGEPGQSLGVHLSSEKSGIWCDFANGGNDAGDLLDLWAKTRGLTITEAIKQASLYLGLSLPQFEAYKPLKFAKPKQTGLSSLSVGSPVMNYLVNERKLTSETVHAYKISERGREIVFPYLRDGEIIFVKYLKLERVDGKKHMYIEANCEPCLFGWHLVPTYARTVTICEGEIDAISLYQYGISALSVPFGAGGGNKQQWIENEFERLVIFDEIYLCLDPDVEGKAATAVLVERLGRHRCRIVKLPLHDANECLRAGITRDEIHRCFNESRTLDPEELKSASEFVEQVIDEFYPVPGANLGYEAPWQKTQGKILFRPAELSIWTGINGHGKSQFIGHAALFMMNKGARICIASLELKPQRLLMRLTRQAGAMADPSLEYIRAIHQWYEDKLWLFDLTGSAKSKRLLDVFLYARQRYGIDVFVIDSFMKIDIAEDDLKAQKAFMEQLCDFKNVHNCHIHIVVHPRKGLDESHPPGKLDNKGTGAISDLADNCFSVWRNKEKERLTQKQTGGVKLVQKELEKLQNSDCLWACDKQRNGDWEGKFGFWFHRASLQYLDRPEQKPVRIVEYSRDAQQWLNHPK